jgi:hypothetical protein
MGLDIFPVILINVHDGLPMKPEGCAPRTPKEVEARKRPKETSSTTISQVFYLKNVRKQGMRPPPMP